MRTSSTLWSLLFATTALGAGALAACGSDSNPGGGGAPGTDAGGTPPGAIDPGAEPGQGAAFEVSPGDDVELEVPFGSQTPTLDFSASRQGAPLAVTWSVDRGDLGAVAAGPAANAQLVPSGRVGGLIEVSARAGEQVVRRRVRITLRGEQSGANAGQQAQVPSDVGELTTGGGVGGVGGEGLGGAPDEATTTLLRNPSDDGQSQQLKLLYPYDGTVFPRGVLAPLLMWDWAHGDADAIRVTVETTGGSFRWSGSFARPAILASTGGRFVRHPIPQDVWQAATDSAGEAAADGSPERVKISVVLARGGVAYGPLTQSYTIAAGRLSGTVYYNSYGTQYAKNLDGALAPGGTTRKFGGATLGIRVGESAPRLIAGGDGDQNQCRVCHSVSANGASLVTNVRDESRSAAYLLTPAGAQEHAMAQATTFPALTPDGQHALTVNGQLLSLPAGDAPQPTSGLDASHLGTPAFSPDGTHLAYSPFLSDTLATPRKKLYVARFDAASRVFSELKLVVDNSGQDAGMRPGWPAFLPDSRSLVFHQQILPGLGEDQLSDLRTRRGARASLSWVQADGSAPPQPLAKLNGDGYLPSRPSASSIGCTADGHTVGTIDPKHERDHEYNYEPTVNPAPTGGYAWVIFTSRRLYGNLATIPPFCSDPRGVELFTQMTTKKLWVAAIDLNAPLGSDPSHPAFYLPAQELMAGNTRGFWVLDPCKSDGASCGAGDECCGGFCRPDGDGALVCAPEPPSCSQIGDKCTEASDCCDPSASCIGGFCRAAGPN